MRSSTLSFWETSWVCCCRGAGVCDRLRQHHGDMLLVSDGHLPFFQAEGFFRRVFLSITYSGGGLLRERIMCTGRHFIDHQKYWGLSVYPSIQLCYLIHSSLSHSARIFCLWPPWNQVRSPESIPVSPRYSCPLFLTGMLGVTTYHHMSLFTLHPRFSSLQDYASKHTTKAAPTSPSRLSPPPPFSQQQ